MRWSSGHALFPPPREHAPRTHSPPASPSHPSPGKGRRHEAGEGRGEALTNQLRGRRGGAREPERPAADGRRPAGAAPAPPSVQSLPFTAIEFTIRGSFERGGIGIVRKPRVPVSTCRSHSSGDPGEPWLRGVWMPGGDQPRLPRRWERGQREESTLLGFLPAGDRPFHPRKARRKGQAACGICFF